MEPVYFASRLHHPLTGAIAESSIFILFFVRIYLLSSSETPSSFLSSWGKHSWRGGRASELEGERVSASSSDPLPLFSSSPLFPPATSISPPPHPDPLFLRRVSLPLPAPSCVSRPPSSWLRGAELPQALCGIAAAVGWQLVASDKRESDSCCFCRDGSLVSHTQTNMPCFIDHELGSHGMHKYIHLPLCEGQLCCL